MARLKARMARGTLLPGVGGMGGATSDEPEAATRECEWGSGVKHAFPGAAILHLLPAPQPAL